MVMRVWPGLFANLMLVILGCWSLQAQALDWSQWQGALGYKTGEIYFDTDGLDSAAAGGMVAAVTVGRYSLELENQTLRNAGYAYQGVSGAADLDLEALTLAYRGFFKETAWFYKGRLGVQQQRIDVDGFTTSTPSTVVKKRDTDSGLAYGLGVGYGRGGSLLEVEYSGYGDISYLSISFQVRIL